MREIKVLDCTLRDGGYINNWGFDYFNMRRVIKALCKANIDIIECGYLNDSVGTTTERTMFKNIDSIEAELKGVDLNKIYVAMINHGEVDVNKLPKVTGDSRVTGIRVVFRKSQIEKAFEEINIIAAKGYKVFVQPMVTLSYTDKQLLDLIDKCNNANIHAVYMVDSFGAMNGKDIKRLSYIFDHNLREDITVGFHAHNNLQLAYPNAIEFIKAFNDRNITIDSSIFGMGRGAGNLPTELITVFLNDNYKKLYESEPIIDIIDKYINRIHEETYWGYSISYYLSGTCNCHPNYALFLVNKNTLTVPNIQRILRDLDEEKRLEFDKVYIEKLYTEFNSVKISNYDELKEFKRDIVSKDIYILAPGKSLLENIDKVNSLDRKNTIIISVNHGLEEIKSDYYFFSNDKRYDEYKEKFDKEGNKKFIFTSNIKHDNENSIIVSYKELLGTSEGSKDNSMIMVLNLLDKLNINHVFIAGFDGYTSKDNYVDPNMKFISEGLNRKERNKSILEEVTKLKQRIDMYFVTESMFNANII